MDGDLDRINRLVGLGIMVGLKPRIDILELLSLT